MVTPLQFLGSEVSLMGVQEYLAFMPFVEISLAIEEFIVKYQNPGDIYAIESLKYIRWDTIESWFFIVR